MTWDTTELKLAGAPGPSLALPTSQLRLDSWWRLIAAAARLEPGAPGRGRYAAAISS